MSDKIIFLGAEHSGAVAELERESFSNPISENTFRALVGGGAYFAIGAYVDGELASYGGIQCAVDMGDIVNIATRSTFRRRGLAGKVLKRIEEIAAERGVTELLLEVRSSNEAAISLYKKSGFEEYGVRRNYYLDPPEDAVLMKKIL